MKIEELIKMKKLGEDYETERGEKESERER